MNPQIDYLTLFVELQTSEHPMISYVSTSLKSKIFGKTELVKVSGVFVGHLASLPMSSILPPDSGLFKFDNSILYSNKLSYYFSLLSKFGGWKKWKLSRLDLCIDFQYFLNFRDPFNFIKDVLCEKFVKTGKTKFKCIGIYNQSLSPQYLKFGSNSSSIAVYLYNKSIEMKEKRFKPYIFDSWQHQHFDLSNPVWRLEFSIKGTDNHFFNSVTGERLDYTPESILLPCIQLDIFKSLLRKYFFWKIKSTKSKFRSWEQLNLFNDLFTEIIHVNSEPGNDLIRSNKVFIKHFEHYLSELREKNTSLTLAGLEVLAQYASDFNLSKYHEFISKF